ncbi:MAG: trigger factor [Leptospiraceae bacterium]|nr:trigger factor [Leptospiraceae bacterium]
MQYKTKRNGSYKVELSIEFDADDIEAAYTQAYQKARSSIKMDGFRKGKVPLDIVEKALGDSVLEDVSNHLLREAMASIFEELDPQPLHLPQFTVEKLERHKKARIKGEYEALPLIKLAKLKKQKGSRDVPAMSNELLDQEIQALRQKHATKKTRESDESIQLMDELKLDLALHVDGEERFHQHDSTLEVNPDQLLPGLADKLNGLTQNTEHTVELPVAPDFQDAAIAGKTLVFTLTIHSATFNELPELDDEFAKDAGDYQDLAELRAKIRTEKLEEGRVKLERELQNSILEALTAASAVEVPSVLIERESEYRIDRMAENMGLRFPGNSRSSPKKRKTTRSRRNQNSESDLPLSAKIQHIAQMTGVESDRIAADLRKAAEQGVAEQLVLREVIEKENITIDASAIDAKIREVYGKHFRPEQLENFVKDEKVRENLKDSMLNEKALEFLVANAEIKKGQEVPVDKIGARQDD